MEDLSSLDELFKEAKLALRGKIAAEAKRRAAAPDAAPDPHAIWRNPANWTRTRGIALIHADTQTLLGNFTEYKHRTHPDARRLVREESTLPVEATEYVSGDWWMIPQKIPKPKRLWKESKLLTLPWINLTHLGVTASNINVFAKFGEGSLERVDLAQATILGGGGVLMTLPEGTDILQELPPSTITAILIQLEQPV